MRFKGLASACTQQGVLLSTGIVLLWGKLSHSCFLYEKIVKELSGRSRSLGIATMLRAKLDVSIGKGG